MRIVVFNTVQAVQSYNTIIKKTANANLNKLKIKKITCMYSKRNYSQQLNLSIVIKIKNCIFLWEGDIRGHILYLKEFHDLKTVKNLCCNAFEYLRLHI